MDVKRLLKTSAFSAQSAAKDGGDAEGEKKSLVKINVEPYYTLKGPEDHTIVFESRFESGNLAAACKVSNNDYMLLL